MQTVDRKPSVVRARPSSRAGALIACVLVVSAALPGCWSLTPELPALDPPPNIEVGQLLVEMDPDVIEGWERPLVRAWRDKELPAVAAVDRQLAQHVLNHRIVTGMESRHVVWAMLAQPTRVVDQGAPGGHTLCWEPDRYWVRLDEHGHVVSAGRY